MTCKISKLRKNNLKIFRFLNLIHGSIFKFNSKKQIKFCRVNSYLNKICHVKLFNLSE